MPNKKFLSIISLLFLLISLVFVSGVMAQGTGSISGTVTAEASGAPLPDIDVDAYILDNGQWEFVDFGFTNASGNYVINDLPAGTYRVLFHDLENGIYKREYYNNKPDLLSANNIVLSEGGSVNNINAALALPQVPPNDLRANATVINNTPFNTSQNVQLATNTVTDPTPSCGPMDGSVWFKITPGQDLTLTASTLGSEYDTVLAVWQGTTEVACNDDSGEESLYSSLEVAVSGGQTYHISVSSWGDHNQLLLDVDLLPENFVTHNIVLDAGWNMISSYVDPWYGDMETVWLDIESDLVLVKDDEGQVFWPELGLNAIGDWNVRKGYQVYMSAAATLPVQGLAANPAQTPISLPIGWSIVSYLKGTPTPIQTALGSINDNILLAKDGDGQIYWPDFSVNQIGDMQPGRGYQLFMESADTLTYP